MMNLVLVHDNEHTKPQFIYVENVERLLHIANTSLYTDANVCQQCNKVVNHAIQFDEHLV